MEVDASRDDFEWDRWEDLVFIIHETGYQQNQSLSYWADRSRSSIAFVSTYLVIFIQWLEVSLCLLIMMIHLWIKQQTEMIFYIQTSWSPSRQFFNSFLFRFRFLFMLIDRQFN